MEASAARRPTRPGPRVPARLLRLASDDRLVELVRAGSEPAFEAVYDRHHRGILAFSRHMVGTLEEAEDAVQHTFMAAYRELVGTDKRIQLRPWLYTIARNRCLTVLRARRERPLEDAAEPQTEHLSAVVQRRQDLRDVLRDLHELPDDQRAALVLAEAGDVSHEEIALVIDVPREKVKALVFQARSSLIASRQARETSCETIREQLAELKGGALRRNTLRRHLKDCVGCREFRGALQDQRRLLALALPVVPSIALKQAVLGGTVGTGTAAVTAAGGGTAAGLAGSSIVAGGTSLTAKALVVVAVAGGGATAVGVKRAVVDQPPAQSAPAPAATPAAGAGAGHGQDDRGAPDATGSGPQPPGAATNPPAQTPALDRRQDAGKREQMPATSAKPDEAPGLAKEEGASAVPVAPPGQAKEQPAPAATPTGDAKVKEDKVKERVEAPARIEPDAGRPAESPAKAQKPAESPGQTRERPESRRPVAEVAPEPVVAPAPSTDGVETVDGEPLLDLAPQDAKGGNSKAVERSER
ncbi:MAG TPA: sigma-70 family RNA polymerase sigma factor [Solirubrobacteraceae bacterium]|nr:sigma-70 family RNA polymerase sigma factor [Solirubrobacteraceae bacterium]